ncbi:hypothetical protein GZL_08736 [Streptomyces sp. 769]|nr:hypothetical protein GZL_08736 [Streptomyces sp. 769]
MPFLLAADVVIVGPAVAGIFAVRALTAVTRRPRDARRDTANCRRGRCVGGS